MLVSATDRGQWRRWLKKHHANRDEAWLVYYKKHTGKPSISYRESVEEALCFGWIDGIKKRLDEERYAHRFTPRRPKSKWSALNVSLARELIRQEKMSPAGLAAFEQRREHEKMPEYRLLHEIEKALKENRLAWENFTRLAPGYKKQYIAWMCSAKKPETRQKRLAEAIRLLEQNKKPGMK